MLNLSLTNQFDSVADVLTKGRSTRVDWKFSSQQVTLNICFHIMSKLLKSLSSCYSYLIVLLWSLGKFQ